MLERFCEKGKENEKKGKKIKKKEVKN